MESTMKLFYMFVLFMTIVSLTQGRHLRKNKSRQFTGMLASPEVVVQEKKEAKKISSSLSSLKLNKVPHRIYLAGNEIIEGFNEQLTKNHVDMRFTYELVEPKLCEMFNPPFGCCWDNRTVALGPNGQGCPACKNKKKSCRKWKDQCGSELVKDICPETCGMCPKPKVAKCQDEPSQKDYCPLYARFSLCKSKQIRKNCRHSCGACDE
ncbi:uncharacterized protein [Clytia hemisphaerica]|uniref:ShKT domain-containing protein n=1 Tax=Clytia hemisphaerica TaxID=252671 RepID=A0A7M5X261_9CNID